MTTLILALWVLSSLAKVLTAALLIRRRVGGLLAPLLLVGVAKSATMMIAAQYGAYKIWWMRLVPLDYIIGCCLTIEACFLLANHFPRPTRFTFFSTAIFGGLSALLVLRTANWFTPAWTEAVAGLVLLQRHFTVACLVVLALNAAFHALPMITWRPNVTRAVSGLACMLVVEIIGVAIIRAFTGAWYQTAAGQILCQLAPMAACAWWVQISEDGEKYEPPRPNPMDRVLDAAVRGITKSAGA